MRASGCALVVALVTRGPAWADRRCDLNPLLGYQIVLARLIAGFIQGGVRNLGHESCEPDRVLVFDDNTRVRCKDLVRQYLEALPTGYLFARSNLGDLKLCVERHLFAVSQSN